MSETEGSGQNDQTGEARDLSEASLQAIINGVAKKLQGNSGSSDGKLILYLSSLHLAQV